jgi:hypothetical protein
MHYRTNAIVVLLWHYLTLGISQRSFEEKYKMNSWIQTAFAELTTVLTILKKWLCTLCGFETEKIKANLEIMKSQLEAENQTLKNQLQGLQKLGELRHELQEKGFTPTNEKIAHILKTLSSEETLLDMRTNNLCAAKWVEMKEEKWATEAVAFLIEKHLDMVRSAKKEDLKQDILNYLRWIARSLRQGDYQELDIVPSVPYPFPYQQALQFLLDKEDTDDLSPAQAVGDLRDCFKHLLDLLGRKIS